jgi:hypothetical protein
MKNTRLKTLTPHRFHACLTALFVMVAVSSLPAFTYTNFSSTNGLNLVGSAVQSGVDLRLTPATQSRLGNAWTASKQPCAGGFNTSFQFQMSNIGGGGGDGIWFAVQNDASDSLAGYPIMGNGTNFVSVWFNTFYNWPGCSDYKTCDVSGNSVGIVSNNQYIAQVNLNSLGINMKDGAIHEGQIGFDGTGLSVWLDGVVLFSKISIPRMATAVDAVGKAWVGFGAFCGSSVENQDILNWSFTSMPPIITSQPQSQVGYWGQSVQFSVVAIPNLPPLSYLWRSNGVAISGATNQTLTLTNLQSSFAAAYTVVVTNLYGSVTSTPPANLTIRPARVNIALSGLNAGLKIDGVVGLTYGIQCTTNVADTHSWNGLTNLTFVQPTEIWYDPNSGNQSQRYYRVVPGPIPIP